MYYLMRYLLFASALAGLAAAVPHTHTHVKRARTFACGNAMIPLRYAPGDSMKDVSQQTCLDVNGGNAPFYTYKNGDTEAVMTTTATIPPDSICEHIMEVQILKQVLESGGGPCDQLAAAPADERQEVRGRFKQITDILNSAPNLVFAQDILEHQKGDVVSKARSGKKYKDNRKNPKPYLLERLKAVDYFVNTQTKADSLKVAQDLDNKIAELFPGTTEKVADKWNNILSFASTCYSDLTPQCVPSGSVSSKRAVPCLVLAATKKSGNRKASTASSHKKTHAIHKTKGKTTKAHKSKRPKKGKS